jgi:GNAT superfamily N-acetyltransferase
VHTKDLFEALLGFERDATRAAGEAVRTEWGEIDRNARHPRLHIANAAWVDRVPASGVDGLLAELDAAYGPAGVPHRSVLFPDAALAFELQPEFVAREFRPKADLAMARLGLPSCIVNEAVEVREVGRGASSADHRAVWMAVDETANYAPDISGDLHDLWRERAALLGLRSFVAYLDGEPAGTFTLWVRGPFAHIDDVGTAPAHRMKGVGRTMIHEACNLAIEARAEWALLVANLFDTPHLMYKTLGFEPIGEIRGFLRT